VATKYAFSFDQEIYHAVDDLRAIGDEPVEDFEVAKAMLIGDWGRITQKYHVDFGATIWIGEARHITASAFFPNGDDIIELMGQQAEGSDQAPGDWAHDYLQNVKPEHDAELGKAMDVVLTAWFEAHPEYEPRWYIVEDPVAFKITQDETSKLVRA
jgi:hypothetical protein